MRKVVAYPVMLASAAGMLLCVFSYLGWLTGSYRFPRPEPPLLFIGIFVVWLPTVLLLNTLTRDFKQKDLWKAALRGLSALDADYFVDYGWRRDGDNIY